VANSNVADEVSIQSKFKSKSTLKVQNKLTLEGESEIGGACEIAENG
jgi:carbonic anhydrase/acetyltransferase-like protein (isoleucine patch superfamily)